MVSTGRKKITSDPFDLLIAVPIFQMGLSPGTMDPNAWPGIKSAN